MIDTNISLYKQIVIKLNFALCFEDKIYDFDF